MDLNKEMEDFQRQMGELMQGKETLAEAMGLSLDDVLALAMMAQQLSEQGQLDNAQSILEGLVVIDPQNAYLHTCLGCVYMQKKMGDAAFDAFKIALHFNKDDIAANAFAGELALERGLIQTAAEHFRRAAELDPDGKNPHANRARVSALLLSTIAKEVEEKGPEVLQQIVQDAHRIQDDSK